MVVGFVNAGIISLTQAVGVIMGANIGTHDHGMARIYERVGTDAETGIFCTAAHWSGAHLLFCLSIRKISSGWRNSCRFWCPFYRTQFYVLIDYTI